MGSETKGESMVSLLQRDLRRVADENSRAEICAEVDYFLGSHAEESESCTCLRRCGGGEVTGYRERERERDDWTTMARRVAVRRGSDGAAQQTLPVSQVYSQVEFESFPLSRTFYK